MFILPVAVHLVPLPMLTQLCVGTIKILDPQLRSVAPHALIQETPRPATDGDQCPRPPT